jgi:hypothetical protein
MMFGWNKSKSARADRLAVPYRPIYPIITDTDRAFIEETITLLIANGLRRGDVSQPDKMADRVCREAVQFGYQDDGQPPRPWVTLQQYPRYEVLKLLSMEQGAPNALVDPGASKSAFENAGWFEDHCLDVVADYYSRLIRSLCAMSGGDLYFDEIAENDSRNGQTVELTLKRNGKVDVISLIRGKDADWSVLEKIEGNLASGRAGRFGAVFDGGALVVYAPAAQLTSLATIIGLEFWTP